MHPRTSILPFFLALSACSEQTLQSTDGGDGSDGLDCWDADGNGEADPAEDVNGDGVVDVLDCQGSEGQDGTGQDGQDGEDGQDCWDTNGNGVADPEEDINGDGVVDAWDCWGQDTEDMGDTGDTGGGGSASGEPYFSNVEFVSDAMMEEFCERYQVVYGGVTVLASDNGEITSLDGLSCLEYVSNDFNITLNTGCGITEVSLPNLEYAGKLAVYAAEYVSLEFPVMESTGQLQLSSPGIAGLSLDSLTEVTGSVDLSQTSLPNLDAFSSLVTIQDSLYMPDNDSMTDLTGMYGVTSVGGWVMIYGNNLFTDDDAWDLVYAIGEANIGGSVSIYSNGSR